MNHLVSSLERIRLSRILLDWAAGITSAVAAFQASALATSGFPNRVLLALSFGLTILFVMRRFRQQGSLSGTLTRFSLPLADAFNSMSECVVVVNKDRKILLANRSLSDTVGTASEQLLHQPITSLEWISNDEDGTEEYPWEAALGNRSGAKGVILGLRKVDGAVQKYLVNASTISTSRRRETVALITLSDVTDLESRKGELVGMLRELESSRDEVSRQNSELHELAIRDPLTGCINRRGFFERFEAMWNRAERYGGELACLMVDIDHFKRVNDTYGHQKGDEVLVGVAEVLKKTFRDTDLICRYGGEEFCVVLPEQDIDAAIKAGERFRDLLQAHDFDGLNLTASLGVSSRDLAQTSYELMIDQADQALYIAKRNDRNCLVSWHDVRDSDHLELASSNRHRDPQDELIAQQNQALSDARLALTRIESDQSSQAISPQAVSALLSALAFRDPTTAEHSARVASLSVSIAQGMMSDREIRVLETAALLHDIGKVGVPDSILLKPGQLDEKEWEVMRRQERMGVEIVRSAFASKHLATLLKTHGAFYGSQESRPGIPSGKRIPLAARIISVCNAYDSMTSDRVYRKGMSSAAAIEELRNCAGQQFDPEIVEQLAEHLAKTSGQNDAARATQRCQSALQLGRQIEQIADAMQSFDLEGLQLISQRLSETANHLGAQSVALAAQQLADSIDDSPEIEVVVKLTQALMDSYHQAHHDLLVTQSTQ